MKLKAVVDIAARTGCVLALGLTLVSGLQAQTKFPSRPLTLIVPFAAGGGTDVIARLIANRLGETLGETVVVENRAGAGGAIANKVVASATADGHTLLLGTAGTQAVSPSLNPNIGFDPTADLAPVARLGATPNLLVVHPQVPAQTVAELVALSRAKPGDIPYASSGVGTVSHLSAVLFARMAGIEINHVPYRGAAPANNDLVSGQVKAMFDTPVSLLPLVSGGRVRVLAVTSATRLASLPEVPTLREAGYADYLSEVWLGVFAPKGVPPAILEQLQSAITEAVQTPAVSQRMRDLGFAPQPGGAVVLREVLAQDLARWGKLIRDAGIQLK